MLVTCNIIIIEGTKFNVKIVIKLQMKYIVSVQNLRRHESIFSICVSYVCVLSNLFFSCFQKLEI